MKPIWGKLIYTLIMLVICASVLFACRKVKEPIVLEVPETEAEAETQTRSIVIEQETEEETEPYIPREERDGMISSFLTGEFVPVEQGKRRPVAVMMSNDKEAAPQYGMSKAGVVYEAPVEGTMNRFMAVIEDYDDLDRIGSVRSCRTYYTYFAREWDAIYAHYGQSTFALPYLKNVDNINGIDGTGGTAFYRSKDKKAPHNAYTSGELLKKAMDRLGYSYDYDESYERSGGHFKFSMDKEIFFEEGLSLGAAKIYPGYRFNAPWFEYNQEDGLYYRYQYDKKHMTDDGQVAVKNVIFQYAPSTTYANTQYLNINLHGESYGYFFTNGRAMPVKVVKDTEFGPTKYYDMEGNEILLNTGKTWICIIQSTRFENTEIYDVDGNKTN